MTATITTLRSYMGSIPRCNQCNYHHTSACWVCNNYGKKGHLAQKCRFPTSTSSPVVNQGVVSATGSRACYEYRETGHFRRSCSKLRYQGGNDRVRGFLIGVKDAIQDPIVVTSMFIINNLYTNILFDSGVDRSYITPKFRQLLNHPSSKLKETYIVEIANGQFNSNQEILENGILTLNIHAFHVNLINMIIRSFDVIICMDLLSSH